MPENPLSTLEVAFDAMREGFGVFDHELRLMLCNQRFIEIRNYPPELCVTGVKLADLLRFNAERGDYDDIDVDEYVASRIAKVSTFKSHEVERTLVDGSTIIVRYTPMPTIGLLTTFIDISALKSAENKVAELARLPEDNPEPVMRCKGDGSLTYFNPAAATLIKQLQLNLGDKVPEQWVTTYRDARTARQPASFDFEISEDSYELTLAPITGANKFNIYGRDVTELKKVERLVAALAKLPEQNPGPVLRFGSDFKFQYANPASRELLHGLALDSEAALPNEWLSAMQRSVETGKPQEFECNFAQDVYEMLAVQVREAGVINIYGRNITQRKKAEKAMRIARDEAQRALDELKVAQQTLVHAEKMASLGQLTAGIAHEIKNPLNFVNNFSSLSKELLQEFDEVVKPAFGGLSPDDKAEANDLMATITGNLDKIEEHGRRADGIVKSMLSHAREGPSAMAPTDVNSMLEDCMNLAYHGMRAEHHGFNVTLERDFDSNLGAIDLHPQEMMRVFLNLIGNGLYAVRKRRETENDTTYEPCLKVSTKLEASRAMVWIRDNGVGMSKELSSKIFEPFFTTKPTGEGTGLGLSLSFEVVVQQHQGTLDVNSVEAEYTEFLITLPISQQRPELTAEIAR